MTERVLSVLKGVILRTVLALLAKHARERKREISINKNRLLCSFLARVVSSVRDKVDQFFLDLVKKYKISLSHGPTIS